MVTGLSTLRRLDLGPEPVAEALRGGVERAAHSPRATYPGRDRASDCRETPAGRILRAPALVVVVRAASAFAAAMSGRSRKLMNWCASS